MCVALRAFTWSHTDEFVGDTISTWGGIGSEASQGLLEFSMLNKALSASFDGPM